MIDLTDVATAHRGKIWKKGDANYNFVRSIARSKIRQFSFEEMANGDIVKTSNGGNFLFGLIAGDEFRIVGTKEDLTIINRSIKNAKRYLFFSVKTKIVNEVLYGVCG